MSLIRAILTSLAFWQSRVQWFPDILWLWNSPCTKFFSSRGPSFHHWRIFLESTNYVIRLSLKAWFQPFSQSLTHSLIHSFTHSSTHSFSHSVLHLLIHQSLPYLFTEPFSNSSTHSLIHSLTHSFPHSFHHLSTWPFTYLLTRSLAWPFIYSFT